MSVATNSEPCLCLQVDLKPFEECSDDWDVKQNVSLITQLRTITSQEAKPSPRLHGIFNQVILFLEYLHLSKMLCLCIHYKKE